MVALSFAILLLLTLRSSALRVSIRLSRGLAVAFFIALAYALLLSLGFLLGNALRLDNLAGDGLFDSVNALVFLGLMLAVSLKVALPVLRSAKQDGPPAFDISRWPTVFLLALASGLDLFLVGLAQGFVLNASRYLLLEAVTAFLLPFLLGYWGIMLGRRHKALKERRWRLIAVLILLVYAFFRMTNA